MSDAVQALESIDLSSQSGFGTQLANAEYLFAHAPLPLQAHDTAYAKEAAVYVRRPRQILEYFQYPPLILFPYLS